MCKGVTWQTQIGQRSKTILNRPVERRTSTTTEVAVHSTLQTAGWKLLLYQASSKAQKKQANVCRARA